MKQPGYTGPGLWGFVSSDVTGWSLGPDHAALVCRRAESIIGHVDRRAAGQQSMGEGWAAVVRQRADQRIPNDQVARNRVAGYVLDKVVAARDQAHRIARSKLLAGVPVVPGNDRVGQLEDRDEWPPLTQEDG